MASFFVTSDVRMWNAQCIVRTEYIPEKSKWRLHFTNGTSELIRDDVYRELRWHGFVRDGAHALFWGLGLSCLLAATVKYFGPTRSC